MVRTTLLPRAGFAAMPWRNGRGTTHEIALDPAPGPEGAPFRWRLSMADLAGSGPFSEIPCVDRVLVLLEGREVVLRIGDGAPSPLAPLEAIAFPGDVPTRLEMGPGTGRDLNLMWDRSRVCGDASVFATGTGHDLDGEIAFAIAVDGPARFAIDGTEHVLGTEDALRIDGPARLAVHEGSVYAARIRSVPNAP